MDACCVPEVGEADDPVFRRILWIALVANLGMFVVEVVASRLGDSISLQADALDFFGDAGNYGISLFVAGMGLAARARASMVKSVTMAAFGLFVIGSAIQRAVAGSAPDAAVMGGIAFVALAVNVSVAVMLYRYRAGDSNMRSIWLCSRNDAIGNVAVIVAAAGVFASATRWPDLAVAAIIAALSLSAAFGVFRLARTELRTMAEAAGECDSHPNVAIANRLS